MTNPETPYEIATRILNAERIGSPGPFLPPSDLYRLARAVIEADQTRRINSASEYARGVAETKARIVAAIRSKRVKRFDMWDEMADWIERGCPDE